MIYLNLPWFCQNYDFNHFLVNYCLGHPESLKFPFHIEAAYGNFSYSTWNGDVNNNWGPLDLYNDFFTLNKNTLIPVRIDCTNLLLEEKNLYDRHQNAIFQSLTDSGNSIELSDLKIFNYLKEKYPNYNYVISSKINYINPLTIENINIILNNEEIFLLNLPFEFQNEESLKQIKNKSKIEINVADRCQCNIENKKPNCDLVENYHQMDFSERSIFQNCVYINNYNDENEILNKINIFSKLGVSHYKIETPPVNKIENFNFYLIKNLIKEEYWEECFRQIIK